MKSRRNEGRIKGRVFGGVSVERQSTPFYSMVDDGLDGAPYKKINDKTLMKVYLQYLSLSFSAGPIDCSIDYLSIDN